VRVDGVVVDRVEIGVEAGVGALSCSGFVGRGDEITRLIQTPGRLSTVAILLTAREFT